MAYLVTNNTFNPYSFDEMVKPLNMYKQAYDQAMNQYDSLGQLAGEWEKLGKEDPQSQAYKDYQAYSQSLNQAANDLATQGLNPEVRNRIRGLNQSFKQTINPIAEAWQRREVARAAQKDALLKNPDLFFQRDLSNPEQGGIDNFIKDTGYGYGQTVNGAQIRANVQNRMAALAKELRGIGQNGDKSFASVKAGQNVSGDLQRVLPYQYRILQEHGFRSEDIQKYLNGEPMDGAIKEVLDGVVNSEIASSGIQSGNFTDDQINRATDIARSGLWAGVGQSDWRYLNDNYGMQAALMDRKRSQDKKDAADAAKATGETRSARTHGIYVDAAPGQLDNAKVEEWRKKNPDKAAAVDRLGLKGLYTATGKERLRWGDADQGYWMDNDQSLTVNGKKIPMADVYAYQKEMRDYATPIDGKISLGDQLESRYEGSEAKSLISAIKSRGADIYEVTDRNVDTHKYNVAETKNNRVDWDDIDENSSVYVYTDAYGNDLLQYTDKKGRVHSAAIPDEIFIDQYDKIRSEYANQLAGAATPEDQQRVMRQYQDNMERLRGIKATIGDTDLTDAQRKKQGVWD